MDYFYTCDGAVNQSRPATSQTEGARRQSNKTHDLAGIMSNAINQNGTGLEQQVRYRRMWQDQDVYFKAMMRTNSRLVQYPIITRNARGIIIMLLLITS